MLAASHFHRTPSWRPFPDPVIGKASRSALPKFALDALPIQRLGNAREPGQRSRARTVSMAAIAGSAAAAVAAAAAGCPVSASASTSSSTAVRPAGRRSSGGGGGLRYFRYHEDFPHPRPAQTTYIDRPAGKGWPEQCPPIRAAQSFGWDVVNPFDMRFRRKHWGEGSSREPVWELDDTIEVQGGDTERRSGIAPFPQDNCWGWDPDQILPHRISPHVFDEINHQVKVSTYLFLRTPPGWAILMGDVPNFQRDFRVVTALLDTDWYFPAHPWHCVIELPREGGQSELVIPAGEPLCRLTPVRRGDYTATEMDPDEFADVFECGQDWLEEHGRPSEDPEARGALDITKAFARQQPLATFTVSADEEVVQASAGDVRGRRGRGSRRGRSARS